MPPNNVHDQGVAGARPKRSSSRLPLIAAVVVGGTAALAAAAYFLGTVLGVFGGYTSRLADKVPADVAVFVEAKDIGKSLAGLLAMDIIDEDEIDSVKLTSEVVDLLAEGLEVDKDVAAGLVADLDAVAFVLRDDKDGAGLIQMANAPAMEALLSTPRFHKLDTGTGDEVRYRADPQDGGLALSPPSEDGDTPQPVYAWHPSEKILVVGSVRMVDDIRAVLEGSAPSLTSTDSWKAAEFDSDAVIVAYGKVDAIDAEEGKEMVADYFRDVAPVTASVTPTPAGLRSTVAYELRGDAVPDLELSAPIDLDIHERLPEETVAYISFATYTPQDRIALGKLLDDAEEEATEAMVEGVDEVEGKLGLSSEELSAAIGEQGVIAVVASKDLAFGLGSDASALIKSAAFGIVLEVGDKDIADKLVAAAVAEIREDSDAEWVVTDVDGGVAMKSVDTDADLPLVQLGIVDGRLYVVGGGEAMVGRFVEALDDGKNVLADMPAHKAISKHLEANARLYAWADIGRLIHAAMGMARLMLNADLMEFRDKTGVSVDALVVDGDDRIGVAVGVYAELSDGVGHARIQSVNGSALLGISGVAAYFLFARVFDAFDSPEPTELVEAE